MLQVQDLHAGYGASEVLHGVDLNVERGSVTALMGRNGMGKTTLLRAITGQLENRKGTVTFKGQPVNGWATHRIARLGLGYVPQGREVFDDFTVEENLRLGLLGHGKGGAGVPESLYQWFPILKERRRQKAGTFSGGQQQMLAIARALAAEPDMLLLDEGHLRRGAPAGHAADHRRNAGRLQQH